MLQQEKQYVGRGALVWGIKKKQELEDRPYWGCGTCNVKRAKKERKERKAKVKDGKLGRDIYAHMRI